MNIGTMCESTLFLEEHGEVREIMQDLTRIVMNGTTATCTNLVGERMVLEGVALKEANLLNHGIVLMKC